MEIGAQSFCSLVFDWNLAWGRLDLFCWGLFYFVLLTGEKLFYLHPFVSWTLYYVWEYRWYFLAAILGSTPAVGKFLTWADGEQGSELGRLVVHGGVFLLFLLAVSELVIGAHNPFIYFNF